MGVHAATVEISADILAEAERMAAMDNISVATLIESLVKRQAEYVNALDASASMPRFSVDTYEMIRDPGETDATSVTPSLSSISALCAPPDGRAV